MQLREDRRAHGEREAQEAAVGDGDGKGGGDVDGRSRSSGGGGDDGDRDPCSCKQEVWAVPADLLGFLFAAKRARLCRTRRRR